MAEAERSLGAVRFGRFELSAETGELRKDGIRLKLSGQAIQILEMLVACPGNLVTREELQQKLWPGAGYGDQEHGLNAAVNKLRETLGDSATTPTYVETVPGRGYRFIGVIESEKPQRSEASGQASAPIVAVETPLEVRRPKENKRALKWIWFAAGIIALALVGALITGWMPPAAPVIEQITQLTDNGQAKLFPVFTDGQRIYFNQGEPTGFRIGEVAIGGGEVGIIPTSLPAPKLVGMAPKGSALLILDISEPFTPGPLWLLPLPAGSPRRLGNIRTSDSRFTPDGRILYVLDGSVVIAEADGSKSRKLLVRMPGYVSDPSLSPDGSRIAFRVDSAPFAKPPRGVTLPAIFVGNADGTGVHPLIDSKADGVVCCASWTADSRYVLVTKLLHRASNIWLVSEKTGLFAGMRPIQLTHGPIAYAAAIASPDGKQILALGIKHRGEVVRYDPGTRQFVPFLSGISALNPTFSGDGKWVAYASYPDDTLWRSRSDGRERLQLTYPPDEIYHPSISPDGKQVVYQTKNSGGAFVISMDGDTPKKVIDFDCSPPDWSPDSKKLVFNDAMTRVLDLTTGQIFRLPGNHRGPQFIAPDKLIAASSDLKGFQIFDFATQQWTDVPNPGQERVIDWAHSPDFKYFYYTTGEQDPKLIRLRVADWKAEVVTGLKEFPLAQDPGWDAPITVAPDGSPILTRELGTQEIYALTVKWP